MQAGRKYGRMCLSDTIMNRTVDTTQALVCTYSRECENVCVQTVDGSPVVIHASKCSKRHAGVEDSHREETCDGPWQHLRDKVA
jgi:hypothetical protein